MHPFFQSHSTGLIIYDASGWVSVQITAPHRAALPVRTNRLSPPVGEDARMKAAASDTYYAYAGSWTFDEARSVVTHHVEWALLEAEVGLDYSQAVTLDGTRLTFTTRDHASGRKSPTPRCGSGCRA